MTQNITFDVGGANEFELNTTNIERIFNKKVTLITAPNSTANKDAGPNDTKVIDLQQIEKRFAIDGIVDVADEAKIEALFDQGGVITMSYGGNTFNVNFEKVNLKEIPEDSDQTNKPVSGFEVKMTLIVGVDL